jgi:3-oxoacyl-[acyl-carrier-protein] synthase II
MALGALRIVAGRADQVLVGGADCGVTPEMLARFDLLRALAPGGDPTCSRPFDRAHCGMVLGDGAGFLVLESAAAARRRRATVHAWLAGWGLTTDAHHPTRGAPDGAEKARAIRLALASAGARADEIEVVSAHGTGTVDNDVAEIRALRLALGAHAERVAVTAAKSALGHSLGASGAVEAGLAVLTLRDGIVPPVLNLTQAAEACAVAGLVRATTRLRPRLLLKQAFAFGGFNACVTLRRGEGGP